MAELAGDVVPPAQHLAVNHHADADAVRDADEHEVAGQAAEIFAHRPGLRERAGAAGVFDLHRQSGRRGQGFAQIDVAPAERRRMQHAHGRVLDHAGHDDADAFAGVDLGVIGEQRLDARGQQRDLLLRIAHGRKADRAGHRRAEQIGQHHERLAGANVGGDHGAAARIDVEKRRLAAAHRFAGRAFEDQAFAQQVVDDQRDRAAAHVHRAREVGARNRLARAHQVQHDAAIDLARRAARGDPEPRWVNSPHLYV